ncbi:MAG: GMC family oxidoreductase N-terminal domain-containing protein [Proteobacteria bacterium]|nr:GMC family oxidoreductase N-terminal domain-containing protein [Pseudomonadota bacterium]
MANLTAAIGNRSACHYCGICERGCSPGSYFSTLSSTLPAALVTGRLTVLTDTIAHSLIHDAPHRRVAGVRTLDAHTGRAREYHARAWCSCAPRRSNLCACC